MRNLILIIVFSIGIITTSFSCNRKTKAEQNSADTNSVVTENVESKSDGNNSGGEVYILTTKEFKEKIFNYEINKDWKFLGTAPVVIDFYADWCKPCKLVAPIMDELAKSYGENVIFYKVNVDIEQELSSVFGVSSIPSILFIPGDGSQPQFATGAMAKDEYIKIIAEVLKVSL